MSRNIAVLGGAGGIGRALVVGDGGKELRELLSMPWGVVSLVDLYMGFTIFSLWIWLRAEGESKLAAVLWTFGMMGGGFWTGSLYLLMAAFTCGGNVAVLMLGRSRAAYHQVA